MRELTDVEKVRRWDELVALLQKRESSFEAYIREHKAMRERTGAEPLDLDVLSYRPFLVARLAVDRFIKETETEATT